MNQPQASQADTHPVGSSDGADRLRPAVVVTGASEGIGLAIAHRFAAAGHVVVLIARRPAPLAVAAREIFAITNSRVITISADLTDRDAPDYIAGELAKHRLYADILVNNAGIGLGGDFSNCDEASLASLIDLNIRALTLLTHHFLPGMLERRSGGIINIASLGGFAPGPYQASYYASKAYVISLSRALSFEMRGTGVHICAVTPGPVETAFHARMGADNALYRKLMPALSANAVANATYRGWRLGFRLIHPGLFTPVLSLLMRLTPWFILVPIVGTLLGARYTRPDR